MIFWGRETARCGVRPCRVVDGCIRLSHSIGKCAIGRSGNVRSGDREMCDRVFVLIGAIGFFGLCAIGFFVDRAIEFERNVRSGFWVYVRSDFWVYGRSGFLWMGDRI
ncbi:hypothetical protein [Microcoleus sp. S13_C5]|uniref:hypothetical protein n=1 Tax=Microcoleus sp. S13_C5 TaxID=3055411 RepID=UPI002FCFCF1F